MTASLTPSGIIGDMGVALARFRCGQMGLIFREKPTHDYGIDAEIEIIEDGIATGRIIAAQIKCGDSFFSELKDDKIIFRFSSRHYDYWTSHSIPVIVMLVDHRAEQCFWGAIAKSTVISAGDNFKVEIPKSQKLELKSKSNIVDLAMPMLSSADFEVLGERDQSHGDIRRLEYKICLNSTERPWTRATIKQLILQQTAKARTSRYFRNELVEKKFSDKAPELVWVFVYQSETHIDKGAFLARALWTDANIKGSIHPSLSHGEEIAEGVRVEWNDRADQIIKAIEPPR